jgi:hypothetical protein
MTELILLRFLRGMGLRKPAIGTAISVNSDLRLFNKRTNRETIAVVECSEPAAPDSFLGAGGLQ